MFEQEFSDCQVSMRACVHGCWWRRQETDLQEMGRRTGFIALRFSSLGLQMETEQQIRWYKWEHEVKDTSGSWEVRLSGLSSTGN